MPNRVKVRVPKGQLDRFRKLARDSRNEVQAFLIGEVVNQKLTVVSNIEYAPGYAIQTPNSVAWYRNDYEAVKKCAGERGKRVVGFIHSHPQWDAVMSSDDYNVCLAEGFRVCGIVSTQRRATRVRFWVMDSGLPCEIVYAKKKAAPIGTE